MQCVHGSTNIEQDSNAEISAALPELDQVSFRSRIDRTIVKNDQTKSVSITSYTSAQGSVDLDRELVNCKWSDIKGNLAASYDDSTKKLSVIISGVEKASKRIDFAKGAIDTTDGFGVDLEVESGQLEDGRSAKMAVKCIPHESELKP